MTRYQRECTWFLTNINASRATVQYKWFFDNSKLVVVAFWIWFYCLWLLPLTPSYFWKFEQLSSYYAHILYTYAMCNQALPTKNAPASEIVTLCVSVADNCSTKLLAFENNEQLNWQSFSSKHFKSRSWLSLSCADHWNQNSFLGILTLRVFTFLI